MGSGNLEVFKFATYLFVPLFAMLHFGDPAWYEHHVAPVKEALWPKYEDTHKPPRTAAELQTELARFKALRQAKGGAAGETGEAGEAAGAAGGARSQAAPTIADAAAAFGAGPAGAGADGSGAGAAAGPDWLRGERRWV